MRVVVRKGNIEPIDRERHEPTDPISHGAEPRYPEGDPDALQPDRYFVMSDAGSVYFDEGHEDGFDSPEAAASWARRQTLWRYGSELDFSDGVTSVIVLGGEVNAANAAWQAWAEEGGKGPYPDVEARNYAVDLGLVADAPDKQN